MSTDAAARGYLRVLAEPRFRVLFGSTVTAIAAETLRILALSVLVYADTGSATLAALAYGAGFLPQVFGSALLGSLADRIRPRTVITVGYLLECATCVVLATGHLPALGALAVVAAGAFVSPVCTGGAGKLTAEVLTGDDYVLGRSLSSMAASLAQLTGLGCGGLAVGALGPEGALLVSASGYLFAAVWLRTRLPAMPVRATEPGSAIRQSLAGNRVLLADPAIRGLLLTQWLPPAFVTGAESLLVPYAADRGFPPGAAGLLLACMPVGMLAGNLVAGRLLTATTRDRLTPAFAALLGAPLLLLAVPLPMAVTAAALGCSGAGFAYGLSVQHRFRDVVPERRRGQAFGLMGTGLMTCQGLGPAVFAGVAGLVPPPAAIALGGAATVVMALVMIRKRPRAGRRAAPPCPSRSSRSW